MSESHENADPLKAFLEEAESSTMIGSAAVSEQTESTAVEAPANQEEVKEEAVTAPVPAKQYGDLLISGCNDWDSMTSSKPFGLEVPHLIRLKAPVSRVFSSSSSCHLFLTLNSGELYSFGKNSNGQLGLGDKTTRIYPTQVKVSDFSKYRVVKVATGKTHTLLVMSDGEIFCCGANNFGQIGMGDGKSQKDDKDQFKMIPFGLPVRDIACGEHHSLFCTRDGQLYAFGHPEFGQLGFGTTGMVHKEGTKRGGLQFQFVSKPQRVNVFCTKDARGKLTGEVPSMSVKIRAVAAGKNHSMCMEEVIQNF